jgi:phenylacetate-CoA ligase
MRERGLGLYQRLPGPLRSFIASVRGLQLRALRYGRETEQLVEQTLERDFWSPEQWETWREERLNFILHRAATQIPYYRDQWTARRQRGDKSSWGYLENWPVLEKEYLREEAKSFVAVDCNRNRLSHSHTSGTTGKPIDLWFDKNTARSWYAVFDARCRRWHGLLRSDRWAILGGQLVTSVQQKRPPFWVWNAPLNQLYMSSYHLAPNLLSHYLNALKSYRISYLYGYTSSLYELALEVLRTGRSDLTMTVAFTNAEPVFDYQRETIEKAFHCPVRETYGMAEMAAGASECEKGSMHLWPEVSWLEIGEGNSVTNNRASGQLIATGLLNTNMPLIRYRLGDQVILRDPSDVCPCGRTLPMVAKIEGRTDDVLYTPDGRSIGRLDPVFKARLPIREAQIVQEALDVIRVRYVPTADYTPVAGRSITERLQARMGNVRVILEEVDKVPRGTNGKFQAVICNLSVKSRRPFEVTPD